MANAVASFASARRHTRVLTMSLLATDAAILVVAELIAGRLNSIPSVALFAAVIVALGILALSGTYRRSFCGSMRDEWYVVGAALGLVAIPLILMRFVLPAFRYDWPAVIEFSAIAFVGMATTRTILHYNPVPRRLAIVGEPDRIDLAVTHVRPRRDDALLRLPVSNIEATIDNDATAPPWLLGAIAWGATRVIVTEELPPDRLVRMIAMAARHRVTIAIAPTRLRQQAYQMKLEREGDLTLLYPRPLAICTPGAYIFKRSLDLILTIPALIVLLPVFAVCAIAIKLDSPGPVIYRQTRLGKNGVPFEMLKFRSMTVDAESRSGPMWADPTLSRTTRVGRFLRRTSIDELPQLVNVARGEMSLVGPRPERPYFVERFRRELPRYDDRHLVAPGITGWSQISMSRVLATDDVSRKLEGDLFYLSEWSPFLDAQIIVKTAFEFLFQRVA